jgi:hypothetical protein
MDHAFLQSPGSALKKNHVSRPGASPIATSNAVALDEMSPLWILVRLEIQVDKKLAGTSTQVAKKSI